MKNIIKLYGTHSCLSAIEQKSVTHIFVTSNFYKKHTKILDKVQAHIHIQKNCSDSEISSYLPKNATHQGIMTYAKDVEISFEDLFHRTQATIIILDQVTDVHNIGAIMRSALAFQATAIILQSKCSPSDLSVIAKTASGAFGVIPLIKVTNIVKSIKLLQEHNFFCYAFDANSKNTLHKTSFDKKSVLIFGSEGNGIRDLVYKSCDFTLSIPMSQEAESLNVSNTAAIVLHHMYVQKTNS